MVGYQPAAPVPMPAGFLDATQVAELMGYKTPKVFAMARSRGLCDHLPQPEYRKVGHHIEYLWPELPTIAAVLKGRPELRPTEIIPDRIGYRQTRHGWAVLPSMPNAKVRLRKCKDYFTPISIIFTVIPDTGDISAWLDQVETAIWVDTSYYKVIASPAGGPQPNVEYKLEKAWSTAEEVECRKAQRRKGIDIGPKLKRGAKKESWTPSPQSTQDVVDYLQAVRDRIPD